MSIPRFELIYSDGRRFKGVVQGNAGPVQSIDRLLGAIYRAREGRETGLYEPITGHAIVYTKFTAADNGPSVNVDLRKVVSVRGSTKTVNIKLER
jgi:hypothetical protein